jgi:hypothetical protein
VFEATDNQMLKLMHFFLNSRGSAANKFALGAAILGLASVVAADLMSRLVQMGALPAIVLIPSDQSPKRVANIAPAGEANPPLTKVVRGIGVDMSPTAAIPGSAPASPCDDTSQAVLMTRSIGMEGTTTTPIAAPEPHCN